MDYTAEIALLEANPENDEKKVGKRVWDETKTICRISLPSMVFRVANFGVFIITQSFIGHIDSVNLAAYALVQTITLRFINGVVSRGVAIGSGSQAKVAVFTVVSYYVIGIPIGCLLAFVAKLGVKGIWIGMLVGMVAQVIALMVLTWRIDWDEEFPKFSHITSNWRWR
ncbi:hypothetical protein V2J09_023829 [Rumex salicifolius]